MPFRGRIGVIAETGRSADAFCLEWRIPDFLSLSGECGDRYQSPTFNACDGEWCFQVYPNGIDLGFTGEGWMKLFFFRVHNGPPITFNITVGVKGLAGVENKKVRRQEFSNGDDVCFWSKFFNSSELRTQNSRLMPGNVLTLTCDMKIVQHSVTRDLSTQTIEKAEEEHQSSEKQGVEELTESLQRLLAGGEDSDVLVKVRGKEFPTHRAILRARSPVFQAMFSHDMVEKQSGVVAMGDCDPASFPAFLQHVYTGSTEMISVGNVFSLYTASDKYDFNALKMACTKFIKNNLTVSCICDAITLGMKHGEKELIECAKEFFCCNALEILKTVEWQMFLKENTTIGNELLIKAFSK